MKNLQQYVGRKVKGIKYYSGEYDLPTYVPVMDKHVGCEGIITAYRGSDHSFRIDFESPEKDYWYYPVDLILLQLEGELVGYLLPTDEKYLKIIAGLTSRPVKDLEDLVKEGKHFILNSYVGEIISRYDLLDKCTPVYKPVEVKLPKINGYEGEDIGDYLQYGCAKISKKWFEETENSYITSLELNSHVRINSKQINLIREYLKFNK